MWSRVQIKDLGGIQSQDTQIKVQWLDGIDGGRSGLDRSARSEKRNGDRNQ